MNARPGESLEYRFRSEKDEQLIGRVYAARETMYVLTETMNVDTAGGVSGRRIYPVGGTVLVELKGVGGDEILTDIARGDESTDVHQVSGNIFRWTVPVTQDGLEPAERRLRDPRKPCRELDISRRVLELQTLGKGERPIDDDVANHGVQQVPTERHGMRWHEVGRQEVGR